MDNLLVSGEKSRVDDSCRALYMELYVVALF